MLQSLQEAAAYGETGQGAPTKVAAPAAVHATGDCGYCGDACGALSTFCPLRVGFNWSSVD